VIRAVLRDTAHPAYQRDGPNDTDETYAAVRWERRGRLRSYAAFAAMGGVPTLRASLADSRSNRPVPLLPVRAGLARDRAGGERRRGCAMSARDARPVVVRHADARAALRSPSAGPIDVLITDPPYPLIERHRGTGSHLRRWFRHSLSWTEIGTVLPLARTRLAKDGVASS
jgi:hypothetical protein